MNKKLDLQNSDISNLMEIAKIPLKVPIRKKLSGASRNEAAHSVEQIRQFIKDEGLDSQSFRLPIPAALIYNRYCLWCKNNYEDIKHYLLFFKKFRLFFNMKKIGNETNYEVNPAGFDTTEENKQFIKNESTKKKSKSKTTKS